MFPWTSNSTCLAPSPCTRLSRAPSTTSESDFHPRFCLPQVVHSVDILGPLPTDQDGGGSPRCHDASISVHAVLLDPAGVSGDHRLLRSPTVAFQIFDPVGLRMCHEAQSLHLRYGLDIALSTLNSCRYLHEPKTRFPVGRLVPFPGRESHPLKAPGLPWRTEELFQIEIDHPTVPRRNMLLGTRDCLMRRASGTTRSSIQRKCGSNYAAGPASLPAGSVDPAPLGCQAFAPLRPASGFPPVVPAAVDRSHSTVVPGWLTSAASSSLSDHQPSFRRCPDCLRFPSHA